MNTKCVYNSDCLLFSLIMFTQVAECFCTNILTQCARMRAYMAQQVCQSVRMIQLENRCTSLDYVWYGRCASWDDVAIVISIWRTNELLWWDRHQRHLQHGSTVKCGNRLF